MGPSYLNSSIWSFETESSDSESSNIDSETSDESDALSLLE